MIRIELCVRRPTLKREIPHVQNEDLSSKSTFSQVNLMYFYDLESKLYGKLNQIGSSDNSSWCSKPPVCNLETSTSYH